MLLAQLRADGNETLLQNLYNNSTKSRVFKLHPDLKHKLLEEIQKVSKPWKGWAELNLLQYAPVYGSNTEWLEKKKYVNFLMNITPAQASAFTPYMRIFTKTRPPASEGRKNRSKWEEKDIIFKTFTDINPILNSSFTRGASAGIKKMSMERHLEHRGASQSYYFTIDFFFSSMKTFINGHHIDPLRGTTDRDYIKLIKNLGGQTTECRDGKEVIIPEERLNIEYGWKIADSTPFDLIPNEIKEIVQRRERKSFALSWFKHDFSFTQTGEIDLSVRYIGTPEELMYKNTTDVDEEQNDIVGLDNEIQISKIQDDEVKQKYKDLKEKRKLLRTYLKCSGSESKTTDEKELCMQKDKNKEIKKLKREISKIKKKVIVETSRSALNEMMDNKQVFQTVFLSETKTPRLKIGIRQVTRTGFGPVKLKDGDKRVSDPLKGYIRVDKPLKVDLKKIKEGVEFIDEKKKGKSVSSMEKELDKILAALTNSEEKKAFGNFFFFPLKALIDWACSRASKKKQEKMPIICLGNMITRSLGKDYWVNIGDILVEVGVFQRWFYDELINKERTKLTLGEFMDSVMNNLVPRVLYSYNTGYQPNTNQGMIQPYFYNARYKNVKELFSDTAKKQSDPKLINQTIVNKLVEEIKSSKSDDKVPFIYYSQKAPDELSEMENNLFFGDLSNRAFNRSEDHDDGMYHLTIGEDRGILQTIDFNYEDDEYLRNAILRDKGSDGMMPFLKYNYKGDARMMGNNLFSNGAYFVIANNPLGIRKEDDPGLLGYYEINRVSDNVSPGEYYTSVSAVNVVSGQKIAENKKKEAEKKETKILKSHVHHRISDYIVDDLLQTPNMSKNYRLRKKKEEKKKDDCPVASKAPQKPTTSKEESQTTSLGEQEIYDLVNKAGIVGESREDWNKLSLAERTADLEAAIDTYYSDDKKRLNYEEYERAIKINDASRKHLKSESKIKKIGIKSV